MTYFNTNINIYLFRKQLVANIHYFNTNNDYLFIYLLIYPKIFNSRF